VLSTAGCRQRQLRSGSCGRRSRRRTWLKARYEEAGLLTTIDGVANVIARSPNPGPALLVGSHSDTQPRGGWLDGAMGVVYGLECARALAEDPSTAHLAVDCASWADEETVYLNMLGSRSFIGALVRSTLFILFLPF
jgi:N-carbamoyl-L-amino-acid hydrolase